MTDYVLSVNPGGVQFYRPGIHNSSAVIFEDGQLVFGAEEERYSRDKHGYDMFPANALEGCLDHCGISLSDVDTVVLPWDLSLERKLFWTRLKRAFVHRESTLGKLYRAERVLERYATGQMIAVRSVREKLADFGESVPPIKTKSHHACHAASAFHPSGFDNALVVTLDGLGEYDSTVVWHADQSGLDRLRTFEWPNSLGHFYRAVTIFLGYAPKTRSEGKIMGLAPYGKYNASIEDKLTDIIDVGVDYDVTGLTEHGPLEAVSRLEALFDKERKDWAEDFTQWEKDLAFMTQYLLEETVVDLVEAYCQRLGVSNVAFAGGVALNCKMNKRVMESDAVDELFVQPVAHDGGITIGAGMLEHEPSEIDEMIHPYFGPEYDTSEIKSLLETNKIEYSEPDDLSATVAQHLADGAIVGWFQGRMEMGPRALGNRSILADPRTIDSRDNVNHFVKHREEWRPFAPSMLEEVADEYLVGGERAPFMIKTFDANPERKDDIEAVLHAGDDTTRPQTVTEAQNPRYYRLIEEFGNRTGVPVVLNTSFNDSGEPIVNRPVEAIRDFYGMGMDVLVLNDLVIEK